MMLPSSQCCVVRRGPEVARTLRALVARLPEDLARYKSVLPYRDAVLTWLDALPT